MTPIIWMPKRKKMRKMAQMLQQPPMKVLCYDSPLRFRLTGTPSWSQPVTLSIKPILRIGLALDVFHKVNNF